MFNWCLLNFLQSVTGVSSSLSFFLMPWIFWRNEVAGTDECHSGLGWFHLHGIIWFVPLSHILPVNWLLNLEAMVFKLKKKSRVFYRSCCVLLIASHQEHIPQIVSLLMMLTLLSEFGCFHSELYFKISQQHLPNGFSAINDDWIVLLFLPH